MSSKGLESVVNAVVFILLFHSSRVSCWVTDMFGLGFQEILLIFLILLLLFGARRLPEIGKGLGRTVKEIRNIRDERRGERGKKKDESKGNLVSEIRKDIHELPGLKEVKEIKDTANKIKSVTRLLK